MKVRTGFVSNSSSSSFVVILPSRPESVEDVEKLFFPDGWHDAEAYQDMWRPEGEDEPITARFLAKTLWADIVEQRKVDDVRNRIIATCMHYAIRDIEDALDEMRIPKEKREHLSSLINDDEAFEIAFVNLILEKARSHGAMMQCFPAKDTNEVYLLSYGSGDCTAASIMFGNFRFLEHLPFVVVMDS